VCVCVWRTDGSTVSAVGDDVTDSLTTSPKHNERSTVTSNDKHVSIVYIIIIIIIISSRWWDDDDDDDDDVITMRLWFARDVRRCINLFWLIDWLIFSFRHLQTEGSTLTYHSHYSNLSRESPDFRHPWESHGKGKDRHSPHSEKLTAEALRCGSHSFYTAYTPLLPLSVSFHQTVPPLTSNSSHLITAYYSFIDPGRMKGWVGLISWPIGRADGLTIYPLPLPISCRSGAGQWKFAGQRPTFYHWVTPLTSNQWNPWNSHTMSTSVAKNRGTHRKLW